MNVLGRLLTMLRERLLERPEFANEREEMLIEIKEAMEAANAVGCLKIGRNEEDIGGLIKERPMNLIHLSQMVNPM
jgi:hypothetical protein